MIGLRRIRQPGWLFLVALATNGGIAGAPALAGDPPHAPQYGLFEIEVGLPDAAANPFENRSSSWKSPILRGGSAASKAFSMEMDREGRLAMFGRRGSPRHSGNLEMESDLFGR
jgi:hypothetical protein